MAPPGRTSFSWVPLRTFLIPLPAIRPALCPRKASCVFGPCWWMTRLRNGQPENHTPLQTAASLFAGSRGLNDSLPGDKTEHWIWQRGPWLMVDRVKGSVTALHLPDYDPAVSNVVWFRDYAAYCGLTASGKQLYAVVAQIAARKPVMAKKISPWSPGEKPVPGLRCGGVAARSAARYLSTDGRANGELRSGWSLRCAGGRRR